MIVRINKQLVRIYGILIIKESKNRIKLTLIKMLEEIVQNKANQN